MPELWRRAANWHEVLPLLRPEEDTQRGLQVWTDAEGIDFRFLSYRR